ncbi:MAG: glutamyl-tRNA reductase [Acidobacteriota bacterium]
MDLVVVGLSHKTAPIEIRERIAFPEEHLPTALQRLLTESELSEGMIVSTCNRVEILAHGKNSHRKIVESVKNFLYSYHSLSPPFLEDYLYIHRRNEAINHLFRVASSLDSMVVGEPQILSQVKKAYSMACLTGSVGRQLNDLIPRAFFVAKKVRTSTRIGAAAVSISSVAIELARKIFGDLTDKSIFLIGAGKMSTLAAKSLLESGIQQIYVTNRTAERSRQMAAEFSGQAVPFEDLKSHLIHTDIALVSTGADSFILTRADVEGITKKRKYRPLFIIDISVPRNVDPEVNQLENVFVYDVDDLQSVINANVQQRQQEAVLAEEIVVAEVSNYVKLTGTRSLGPVASALRTRIETMCLEELNTRRHQFTEEEFEQVEKLLKKAAHKIAHPLITNLRDPGESPRQQLYKVELFKKIFQLEEES